MPKAKAKKKALRKRGNKPGSNGGGGRKAKDPFTTDKELEKLKSLAASGVRMEDIAHIYGMSKSTLYELMKKNPKIREYTDMGRGQAIYNVASSLYDKAVKGDLTAQIFYLKTQGGWKDRADEQQKQAAMQSVRIVLPNQGQEQVISIGAPEQVIDVEAEDGTTD